MTLNEFKAWFEGYTEGLDGAPTAAQFARIKEKVKEISGTPVTERIFVDSYRRFSPYYDHLRPYWTSGSITVGSITGATGTSYNLANSTPHQVSLTAEPFDSIPAMYALGKTEASVN